MYKMVAFDIDGTLVNHLENEFSSDVIEMFKKLKSKNFIVTLATGRDFVSINNLYQNEYIDYFIGANGAFIYDCKEKKYLYNNVLNFNDFEKYYNNVLVNYKQNIKSIILSDSKQVFIEEIYDRSEINWFWNAFRTSFVPLNEAKNKLDKDYFHLITIEHKLDSDILKKTKDYFNQTNSSLSIQAFWPKGIFISNKGVSKAHTIKILCEKLGLGIKNVIAFGDGENDIEMIKEAGMGVAMGNAVNQLKEIADETTIDVNDIGTKFFLEKNGII